MTTRYVQSKADCEALTRLLAAMPLPYTVNVITGQRRDIEINSAMWAVLRDIARQVEWPVNGYMQKLSVEDWKDIISAGANRESRVAQGVDGGFVMLGQRTSQMTQKQMRELIALAKHFGDSQQVRWSAPKRYEEFA